MVNVPLFWYSLVQILTVKCCSSKNLIVSMGMVLRKLSESLEKLFPSAKNFQDSIKTLTTKKAHSWNEYLNFFWNGEPDY